MKMDKKHRKIEVNGREIAFFKLVEFDQFRAEAGLNHFVLSPQRWVEGLEKSFPNSRTGSRA